MMAEQEQLIREKNSDLEKKLAELTHELDIQASLEKVRGIALAIQKTTEFIEVIDVIGEQFIRLGFDFDWVNFSANGIDVSKGIDIWNFVVIPGKYKGADRVFIPFFDHPVFTVAYEKFREYRATGNDFYALALDKETKDKFADHLFTNTVYKDLPDEFKKIHYEGNGYITSSVFLKDTWLSVGSYKGKPFTDEQNTILKRLANCFGQAYTRFLDLQKAEAQAREAQIQLALERVRAKSLAMHHSSELQEVVNIVAQQLHNMNIDMNGGVFICINKEVDKNAPLWAAAGAADYVRKIVIPYSPIPTISRLIDAIKKGNNFLEEEFSNQEKKEFFKHLFRYEPWNALPEERKKELLSKEGGYTRSVAVMQYTSIAMINHNGKKFSSEENEILKRFGNVFEQSYTRFLDLQKAEAQAREAQIETALERVRSRSMAMHKSDELLEVINVVSEQLQQLNIRFGFVTFGFTSQNEELDFWLASPGFPRPERIHMPAINNPITTTVVEGQNKHLRFFSNLFSAEVTREWIQVLCDNNPESQIMKKSKDVIMNGPGFARSAVLLKDINVFIGNFAMKPLSDEQNAITIRFANVFEQSYTRFLDLQKAEAQAREAQIEAGLERVRSRAMAMQTSEELNALIGTVFAELTKLDLILTRCVILIYEGNGKGVRWWMANSEAPSEPMNFFVKYADLAFFNEYLKGWQEKLFKWQYILEGENKVETDNFLFKETELSRLPDFVITGMRTPDRIYLNASFNNFGNLTLASLEPLSDEHFDILLRFAKVFDLTYTRFNDLKQAEAQAREAQIEAALEKVRASAMAMRNSNDLSSTASMVFTELRKLGINPIRCGVGLLKKESKKAQLYSATSSTDGDSLSLVGWVMLSEHSVLEKIYDTWLNNEDYFPELSGKQLKSYYQLLLKGLPVNVPESQSEQKQYGHFLPFSVGCLYAWSAVRYNDSEIKILKRFASIIDLTFRRYIELQKAEANAKEAVKRASLDRVRAETASMRTTGDLEKITPLMWNELTTLNVPFIRCGVFIMDEEQELIHSFLSTPEGKAIAAFQLPYHSAGELSKVLIHWHKNEMFKDHWDEATFANWTKSLVEQGAIASEEKYSTTHRPVNLYLHFLPFLQGMLYVGSEAPLNEEEINLVQTLASAFSTAYARYEDFNKLESAKEQIEKTLVDLKQAQAQLIQSEKMASLGELTAGIAHEIQNPLNFVNNFSEVSNELVDEMNEELEKGDLEEAKTIATDIKHNLEKINHHGKRADAIVKGMLQHSRKSSGHKEPTDINALADEYLRLSYHGLRAKDKNFNATIETDFDNTIGKINIIPLDIGRVLLNLFNNAFYAVNEQKNRNPDSYEPTVSVSTKKSENRVTITVKDNGSGIPQNIIDKIFQPFFTTKPTGSGTGLGLSLSYDIIKAHGGEISVSSKEGAGTTFMILMPL